MKFNSGRMRILRQRIYERDQGICRICQLFIHFEEFQLGHLVDICVGGGHADENLTVMCGDCNDRKPLHLTLQEFEQWNAVPYPEKFFCYRPLKKKRFALPIGEIIGYSERNND